jgi:hypothetical protein
MEISCICGGNERCKICKGSNLFKIYSCPTSILNQFAIARLFKFYYQYREHNVYPDGRGLYQQPIKLIEAFNFLTDIEYAAMMKDKKNEK